MIKTNIRFLMILAALGVVFVFASNASAQARKMPIVGGYKALSVNDAEVVKASNFALIKMIEKSEMGIQLVSIEKAEYQMVAGKNFRVCMKVNVFDTVEAMEDGGENEQGFLNAVVFYNLKGEFSLTSGTVVENCGKK